MAWQVATRFTDVAGLAEAKAEIMEFVDILQNPERYMSSPIDAPSISPL